MLEQPEPRRLHDIVGIGRPQPMRTRHRAHARCKTLDQPLRGRAVTAPGRHHERIELVAIGPPPHADPPDPRIDAIDVGAGVVQRGPVVMAPGVAANA